ncbi:MAG: hypothetical protein ACLP8S_10335 [Solirubrobacteraceae bacterium]
MSDGPLICDCPFHDRLVLPDDVGDGLGGEERKPLAVLQDARDQADELHIGMGRCIDAALA